MKYSTPLVYLSGINLILVFIATLATLQIFKFYSKKNSITKLVRYDNQDTISSLQNYEHGCNQAEQYLWAKALGNFHNGLQLEKNISTVLKKAYYEAIKSVYMETGMSLLSEKYYVKIKADADRQVLDVSKKSTDYIE